MKYNHVQDIPKYKSNKTRNNITLIVKRLSTGFLQKLYFLPQPYLDFPIHIILGSLIFL